MTATTISAPATQRVFGVVTSFNTEKGFGFASVEGHPRVFIHSTNMHEVDSRPNTPRLTDKQVERGTYPSKGDRVLIGKLYTTSKGTKATRWGVLPCEETWEHKLLQTNRLQDQINRLVMVWYADERDAVEGVLTSINLDPAKRTLTMTIRSLTDTAVTTEVVLNTMNASYYGNLVHYRAQIVDLDAYTVSLS